MKRILLLAGLVVLLIVSFKMFPRCGGVCESKTTTENTQISINTTQVTPESSSIEVSATKTTKPKSTTTITLGKVTMEAFIADTPALEELGLSGRASLPINTGMLFIFSTPGAPGFWMKDMKFSLDMVWISPEGKVVGITKNISPSTYPKAFYPPSVIKYVLEVPAGFSDTNRLKVGDFLSIGQ